jgi:hypothetical protein
MTDDAPAVPSFAATLLHSLAQKAGTAVATALLARGIIASGQTDQDASLIAGGFLMAGSLAWTWVRSRIDHNRAVALAAAPPSQPKETTMNLQEAFDALKAKAVALAAVAEEAWAALPAEFQHPAVDALKAGVADVAEAATVEADKVAPPSLDAIINAGIAAIQADADAKIAALQAVKPVAA